MLINLRNALMAGKRLPYDAEVEFLESTGMQYIDTDIVAADDVGYELRLVDWQSQWSSNTNFIFAGVWGSSNRYGLGYAGGPNQRSSLFVWWNTSLSELGSLISISDGYLRFNFLNSRSYDYNGVISGSLPGSYNASNTTILLLNAKRMDTGENVFSDSVPAKISAFKISKGDIIVRDFIPVRKGTVGYLYDRVSGKLFGNAGTGDFVLGPDVVPVEYIESHGTEYIDTGVPATGATDSEFQFKMSVAGFAFGARTAWNASAYSLNYAAGNYAFNYGNDSVIADLKTNIRIDTNWHTAKIQSGGVLSLDEWTGTAGTFSFTTNGSLILFGTRQGSSLNLTASGFKYCKIWGNSLPVRSFRPVRVGTDATSWEGAMMDMLTRRIYRNAGTGAFTYGNDLKYPIPAE